MLGGKKVQLLRHALCLALGAGGLLAAIPAQAAFTLRSIVEENRLTSLGVFQNVAVQGVSSQGQVMFLADLKSVFDSKDQALFLWVDGRIVRLIGRDDPVPGGKIRSVRAAVLAPRSAADRAFLTTVRDDQGAEQEGLYVSAEGRLRRILRVGDLLEPGRVLGLQEDRLQINGKGEVLLLANLDVNGDGRFEAAADTRALYLYSGGALKRLAAVGDTLGGARVSDLILGPRSLNDNGRVAWEAVLETDGAPESVVVVSDRTRSVRVLRAGEPAQGGRVLNPHEPVLNEPGNVAFVAELDRNGNGRFEADRDATGVFLFRPRGAPPTLTLLRSDRLERGDSQVLAVDALNDFNVAAVAALVDRDRDGRLDADDREAIYLAATTGVVALARGGQRAIGGFVERDADGEFDPPKEESMLLFADRGGPVAIARDRQFLGGEGSGYAQLLNIRGPHGLTDGGVLVFSADLDRNFDHDLDRAFEGRAILLAIP
jgi:hypothetical protein